MKRTATTTTVIWNLGIKTIKWLVHLNDYFKIKEGALQGCKPVRFEEVNGAKEKAKGRQESESNKVLNK